jgi:hypothetical protein
MGGLIPAMQNDQGKAFTAGLIQLPTNNVIVIQFRKGNDVSGGFGIFIELGFKAPAGTVGLGRGSVYHTEPVVEPASQTAGGAVGGSGKMQLVPLP